MNNIQKAFKTKSKLRGMADGGQVRPTPEMLGSGMAQRAGAALQGRQAQIDAAIDAAERGESPAPAAPAPAAPTPAAPSKKPEEKSALRSFFGFADGGQIFKSDVGGVPTFTDAKAASPTAKAYTPGQGGGTFSVVGMEPAQKQQMADSAAARQAAASAPTTLGGRLDAALGKLSSPLATAGAPSSTPTLGSELDAAIGRTKGVTSPQTPATGAPANDVNRIMNSRDMSTFSPREKASFNAMASNANSIAAQNVDLGLSASRTPGIPTDTVFPSQLQQDYQDFFGLADGGKVKGKGGPTDDEVGPVMLSHGEYVLPADTVDIVGRDKLDALRLATHDFVDDGNKPKVSGLRKMANGGTFYVDPEGVASRQMPPGRAVAPYQPPVTKLSPTEVPRPPAGVSSPLGSVARTGGALLGAGLEAKNVYDAYQSGGVDAAVPEAAMGATRLASARLGASVGAALPLPGWGKPVAASVGGVVGYMAPNAVANSEYVKEKGRESALRGAFSSRLDRDLAPTFDPRANTITTSDGRVFGSGRLESNPHLQYQGYLDAKAGQAVDSKEPLMNPTVAELDAIGALRPREAPTAGSTDSAIGAPRPDMGNVRTSSAGMPATPVQPQSYQSRRLAEMGVPVDQQNLAPVTDDTRRSLLREGGGTPGQYVNLGSYGGDANIYGTASKPGGRIDSFTGVGASSRPGGGPQEDPIMGEIRSALRGLTDGAGNRGGGGGAWVGGGNSRDINERYDKLAKQLSGMYSSKGQGNLARRLLELEQSRSGALDADARNQSALRGQDMQASTAANSASMQARMLALQTLGTMANQRSTQSAQAQAAQLKALQDAQKMGVEREEKGFERYNSAISSMFIGPDGKPDAAEQERFTSFLQGSDPQAREKFSAMSPQDQMVLLQNFKTMYDMNKARNATATGGVMNSGATTNRADMPVDVRESTWNDVWNNHLPVSDYLYSNLPFTNPNVVVGESGQPVLMSDAATTDGNWDADKLELIRQRTGKDQHGRSALRGN